MQYIAIKKEIKNGEAVFIVNAISLKNKNKSIVQKIPHPLGSDSLCYKTLEDAKQAITRSGFSYILPDGQKEIQNIPQKITTKSEYSDLVFEAIKNKTSSQNQNVSAAAVLAISEFQNEETFKILFDKLGEENDLIRKNAICGICRYGKLLQDKIIETLKSTNWVSRNSAISCISNLTDDKSIELEKFIIPLVNATNDKNPIVQANAISTLAIVFQAYQTNCSNK